MNGFRPFPKSFEAVVTALTLALALSAAGVQAQEAAGPKLQVKPQFELHAAASPTALHDIENCLGSSSASGSIEQFQAEVLASEPSRAHQLQSSANRAVVLATAGQWACVPISPQGYPVWPLETLHGLIVPVGVPADVVSAWRAELLAQVARDGVGRGLIVYPSGDAERVHVIAELGQALHVKYTTRLLRAGEFVESHYSAVLRHPGLTKLVTRSAISKDGKQSTPSRLAIPPHRLLQPVRDGFVLLASSAATQAATTGFDFNGTRWKMGDAELVLLPGGVAVQAQPGLTPTAGVAAQGQWQVLHGVLRISLPGQLRYSLAVAVEPFTLTGMARRVEAQENDQNDEEGGEYQWPLQLRLFGAPAVLSGGALLQAALKR